MTAAAARLRQLAADATPGPWRDAGASKRGHLVTWQPADGGYNIVARCTDNERAADARLIALAPELASLVADMADALAYIDMDTWRDRVGIQSPDALLVRVGELADREERA